VIHLEQAVLVEPLMKLIEFGKVRCRRPFLLRRLIVVFLTQKQNKGENKKNDFIAILE